MRVKGFLRVVMAVFWACFLFAGGAYSGENGECQCPAFSSFYCKSLHFTGKGMRYWYEAPDGFMKLTGIPYDKLSCNHCHATSCDKCHGVEKNGKMAFSIAKTKKTATCYACHLRGKVSAQFDEKAGFKDVHMAKGMTCTNCHHANDVHGNGTSYYSMRDKGAVEAKCTNCHKPGQNFNAKLRAHRVHRGKLGCEACHVKATMTCYNCHFIEGHKKTAFFPVKTWTMLVNYNNKVTVGGAMTLVWKGKKFIAYAPRFTHSIMAKGRDCADCHGNKAMQLIKSGKKVPVMDFKDGKVIPWKGVVPLAPQKIYFAFMEKDKNGKWYKLPDNTPIQVQFADYARPLTKKQLKRLMMPFGRRRQ